MRSRDELRAARTADLAVQGSGRSSPTGLQVATARAVIGSRAHRPIHPHAVARRAKEGLSKPEIIRCLKRYTAREIYPHLRG